MKRYLVGSIAVIALAVTVTASPAAAATLSGRAVRVIG
jgi:hypothetical protein